MSEPKFRVGDKIQFEGIVTKVCIGAEHPIEVCTKENEGDLGGGRWFFEEEQVTLVSRPEPMRYQVLYEDMVLCRSIAVTNRVYESEKEWRECSLYQNRVRYRFIMLLTPENLKENK